VSQLQHTAPQAGIFRRKPIVADSQDSHLERSLGLWQLTAIGIGAIIFSLAGTVANRPGRPRGQRVVSHRGCRECLRRAVVRRVRGDDSAAGSAYTYGHAVLGEFAGWMTG
jgi:basic amino acid/polyamine antiporter, APA family